MTQLFRYFQDKESVLAEVANHIIDDVLESCRQQYGKGSPLLGNSLYLKDASGKPQLVEVMDPALESVLRTAPEIFGDEPTLLPLCLDQIYNMLLLRRARSWHKSNPSGFKGNCMLLCRKRAGGPERSVQPFFIANAPSAHHPSPNGPRYGFRGR